MRCFRNDTLLSLGGNMKAFLIAVQLLLALMVTQPAFAERVKVDQSKYTCQQLKQILDEYGSIWVKNRLFPWVWQNIALHDPVCNGAARSRRDRICRWYDGKVTAKDGRCTLGTECSCRAPQRDDD